MVPHTQLELDRPSRTPADYFSYSSEVLKERVMSEHSMTSRGFDEAFTELKKFLLLSTTCESLSMTSSKIDAVWHEFIADKTEYAMFCQRFFGGYLAHVPASDAAQSEATDGRFIATYTKRFGPLPEIWGDATTTYCRFMVVRS